MQSYGWRNHVNMMSLLQVIEKKTKDRRRHSLYKPVGHAQATTRRRQVVGVCTVDDVSALSDRWGNEPERNIQADNPQIERFFDSDNILLSVFDHESRRRRELTRSSDHPVLYNDTNIRFPRISSHPVNRFHKNTKLAVSVPSDSSLDTEGPGGQTVTIPRTGLVRLQYCHRSREESVRNINNKSKIISIVNDLPNEDSIDIVVAANQPSDYTTTTTFHCTPPVIGIDQSGAIHVQDSMQLPQIDQDQGSEVVVTTETTPKKGHNSVIIQRQLSVDFDEDIECLEDDPDVALIPVRKNTSGRRKHKHPQNQVPMHQYSVDQNLHRNVYMRALRDARNKYFKHVPLDKTVTKPFEFSYFTLLNRNEDGEVTTEKRMKKPYGMKRIFGEIRMDEYYPVVQTKK
ncbi:uncharacterized protein LOC110459776 [Mizuhopecten yessoensis]|uniref:uncharacterized protein LOC110459776 n=1 Tax=Mizuhopecten yessoensis TaxID=6573 RepID=UPI000B45E6A5|nr:uncharacterized protein LOC110459776 [Mizuhopecten yessoensis]